MRNPTVRARLWGLGALLTLAMVAGVFLFADPSTSSPSGEQPAAGPPPATTVSVAVVEERAVAVWDEFSGRLEAIERVALRPRVAGEVQEVHFREGALVTRATS